MINCQLILHDTNEMNNDNSLQFICLYYCVSKDKLTYQELSNVINEAISYCFRPLNRSENQFSNIVNTRNKNLTFEEFRINNISTEELLSWSTPIGVVEKYQLYLNEKDLSLSNEFFYNCTKPYFGLRCQYSFEFSEDMSIMNVVENEFNTRCDRGGIYICLNWREICNGSIDCIDQGLDEAFSFI
ncbi:unnamed protein product [Rotaria sp. Silwood2]|nr:unnamed protein product [Rotaria sp. Silwood2]CAF3195714.1 unnamed protein product [Rotaria sp. Silwood2]CAF4472927.1 unnamed protein product [Rotaria sp. Silwood2]CAF4566803.1 unnamed protein product [Rotaria sp. Silwood2]